MSDFDQQQLIIANRELQLHVTRFSVVEQELINAKNQLDHELELYKRLSKFNYLALNEIDNTTFLHLITETIIDILEIETSVVLTRKIGEESQLFVEGKNATQIDEDEVVKCIDNFIFQTNELAPFVFSNEQMAGSKVFSQFNQALFFYFEDKETKMSCVLMGLISIENAPLYRTLDASHSTIFNLFCQQVRSLFFNRYKSQQIEEQLAQIHDAEIELRKLSMIATKSKNGVVITDAFGCVEWINDSFIAMTGFELSEVKGKKPKDFLHGELTDLETVKTIATALRKHEGIATTVLNYRKNRTPYFVNLEITPVFNEENQLINFIALQRDISEERKNQQDLLQINSRFELITTKSQIGIWENDLTTDFVMWNQVLIEQYGIVNKSNDNFNSLWEQRIHPDDFNRAVHEIGQLIKGERDIIEQEFRIYRENDNELRIVKGVSISEKDDNGRVIRLIGTSIDITEAKQSENRLKKSEEKYRGIIDHVNIGLIELDKAGEIVFMNRKINELLPLISPQNLIVMNCPESELKVKKELGYIESYLKVADNLYEIAIDLTDKSKRFFLVSNAPNFNGSNQLAGYTNAFIDITDLKNIELVLLNKNNELKKINSELDNFVYSVSHDLRSPLLSIKGLIMLTKMHPTLDTEIMEYLNMAESSVNRLDGTIQEILEYSRNARLEITMEPVQLCEMASQIFEDLKYAAEDYIDFKLDCDSDPLIISDKTRINTLLKNIIGNAVKYRSQQREAVIEFSMKRINNKVAICIKDNGEGIPADSLAKIFNMFYRASKTSEGTGLGLYICKEIVTKLNGSITIDSQLGVGTTVNILI